MLQGAKLKSSSDTPKIKFLLRLSGRKLGVSSTWQGMLVTPERLRDPSCMIFVNFLSNLRSLLELWSSSEVQFSTRVSHWNKLTSWFLCLLAARCLPNQAETIFVSIWKPTRFSKESVNTKQKTEKPTNKQRNKQTKTNKQFNVPESS